MTSRSSFLQRLMSAVVKWTWRGMWTVFDQGFFSGANFTLTVLLARWLDPKDFGAFSVAYGYFVFLGATAHTGIFTEPMLVYGPSTHKDSIPQYLATLLRGHIIFALIALLGFSIGSMVATRTGSPELGSALLVLGVAQIFLLFFWMLRRSFYINLQPRGAAIASFVYAGVMLVGTYVLYKSSMLSPNLAFAVMSVASLAGGLWVLLRLRVQLLSRMPQDLRTTVISDHWKYSRWAVPSNIVMSVPSQLPLLVLHGTAGLEVSAALRATRLFAMPAAQAYTALFILLIPAFVKANEKGKLHSFVLTALIAITAGTSLYWVLLATMGGPLVDGLYGGKYSEYSPLLWIVGAQPVVAGIAAVYGAALRALKRPHHVFWAYAGTAIGVATIGVWAILRFGIKGALVGYIMSNVIGIVLMLYFFYFKKTPKVEGRAGVMVTR